ncbi:MAG: leucyl aminopeptidase [Rhodocyclaceae bacterium]|nr:leucyl aminopeptidase [Rhodocyclaceae bacterium]
MQFTIKSGAPEKQRTPCLAVGVFAGTARGELFDALDRASDGALASLLAAGELDDKAGASLLIHAPAGLACQRLLLVSLGEAEALADKPWRDAVAAVARYAANAPFKELTFALGQVDLPARDLDWRLEQAARMLADAAYRFTLHKANAKAKADNPDKGVTEIRVLLGGRPGDAEKRAVERGLAVAEGMALTRDLGNLAGNICTPSYLAGRARKLGKEMKLKVEVLERAAMEKLGMGSLLSVAKGSAEPPKLIVMHYRGAKAKDKPVVLVGKGITFDTGGISLKPGAEMDEMKFDMCGAASVFGTVKAVARMGLPINLIGVVPAAENMPGGRASKPGDVVESMSGQTIEILNTDAEGRLILCDALTYVERYEPACVVDIATLTGACIIALGKIPSGLLANDDELAGELLAAGQSSGDRAWQLPLWDEYQELLKSNFADMANIGGRYGGAITAAAFLARFTKKYSWAHLDIAGTAWLSGDAKGATGRPVPLLSEFLIGRAGRD